MKTGVESGAPAVPPNQNDVEAGAHCLPLACDATPPHVQTKCRSIPSLAQLVAQQTTNRTLPEIEPLEVHKQVGTDRLGVWVWRALLLLCTATWGSNYPLTENVFIALGPSATHTSLFLAARFLLSAIVLAPAALSASSWAAVTAGGRVGVLCAIGYLSQAAALAMGSQAGQSAFICSLQAVVIALHSALAGNGISRKTAVAVALAVCGVGFLELPSIIEGGLSALCLGDLVALGQPFGFGASYIVIEQALKDHPNDALPLAAMQCVLVGAATLGIASATAGAAPWDLPFGKLLLPKADASSFFEAWAVPATVAYTGIWGTAATIWIEATVLKRLPIVDASVILSTEPLWATGLAALMLGEVIGVNDVIGGAFIIIALLVNEGLLHLPGQGEEERASSSSRLTRQAVCSAAA